MFDDELQHNEAFSRVAEAGAGLEMNAQLVVGFYKPEVVKAGGMSEAHARRDLFPAQIASQIRVRFVLVREDRIGAVGRQRTIEVVFDGSVEI